MRLFVGDECAQYHHYIEVIHQTAKVLARKLVPESAAAIAQLHSLLSAALRDNAHEAEVIVQIETDHCP